MAPLLFVKGIPQLAPPLPAERGAAATGVWVPGNSSWQWVPEAESGLPEGRGLSQRC